jgi:16S rRNA (guanine527-N7)-methyltransferase
MNLPLAEAAAGPQAEALWQACHSLHLSLANVQYQQLVAYVAHMERWNRTYNLTAIRGMQQMLVHHIFDSLAVVKSLVTALEASSISSPCIYDIGSGAGLPGVVLAIACPHWQVCCIDAVEKKVAFVRQMIGALSLYNLSARHARVEQMEPGHCDVVISRAFASLDEFVRLAGHHAGSIGTLVAMKGKVPEEEIQAVQAHGEWKIERIEPITVPQLNAQRCLVWIRRSQGTP